MERNNLYPVFLRLDRLKILIVGGGEVAEEKLTFLLKSSPNAQVKMVATFYRKRTIELADNHGIERIEKPFDPGDLEGVNIVIAATNFKSVNHEVYDAAKSRGLVINVADTPELCDFYMGAIVTKGNIKVAISSNGTSPTLAKRMRQYFESAIPDNISDLAENLNRYRERLNTEDFEQKVRQMNEATEKLLNE